MGRWPLVLQKKTLHTLKKSCQNCWQDRSSYEHGQLLLSLFHMFRLWTFSSLKNFSKAQRRRYCACCNDPDALWVMLPRIVSGPRDPEVRRKSKLNWYDWAVSWYLCRGSIKRNGYCVVVEHLLLPIKVSQWFMKQKTLQRLLWGGTV